MLDLLFCGRVVSKIEALAMDGLKHGQLMMLLAKEVDSLLRELGLEDVPVHDTRFYPTEDVVRGIMKRARMQARLSQVFTPFGKCMVQIVFHLLGLSRWTRSL